MATDGSIESVTEKLRREVIDWAVAVRKYEGERNAGDPSCGAVS